MSPGSTWILDGILMNEAVFQNDLLRGEKILWVGQPETTVWFTGADIFLVPFSLVWSGIAITAAASALGSARGMGMFAFIPLLFTIFGVYFVLGRFVYKYWRKKNTNYAVTDKRVLVRTRLWGDHLQAANVDTIPSITKSVGRGGIGTISPAPLAGSSAAGVLVSAVGRCPAGLSPAASRL